MVARVAYGVAGGPFSDRPITIPIGEPITAIDPDVLGALERLPLKVGRLLMRAVDLHPHEECPESKKTGHRDHHYPQDIDVVLGARLCGLHQRLLDGTSVLMTELSILKRQPQPRPGQVTASVSWILPARCTNSSGLLGLTQRSP